MPQQPSKSDKKKAEAGAKSVSPHVTLEDLGLTVEEMELFAKGARLLFGTGKETPDGTEE